MTELVSLSFFSMFPLYENKAIFAHFQLLIIEETMILEENVKFGSRFTEEIYELRAEGMSDMEENLRE